MSRVSDCTLACSVVRHCGRYDEHTTGHGILGDTAGRQWPAVRLGARTDRLLRHRLVRPRTYMHWTAVSAARGASRAAELAAKVTSAQDVLPTSGLLATAMEMPNIDRILAVNITV